PLVSMILLLIACCAAMLWLRSYSTVDTFARMSARNDAMLVVRSIYGRILVTRDPQAVQPVFEFAADRWNYEQFPAPVTVRDPWADSWKKRIGVEWQRNETALGQTQAGAFWLRIRWPTIVVLCGGMPLIRVVRFEWLRWRQRRLPRGFTPVLASRTQ